MKFHVRWVQLAWYWEVQHQPNKSIIQATQIQYQDYILNVRMQEIILRGITGIVRTKKGLIDAGSKTAGYHL